MENNAKFVMHGNNNDSFHIEVNGHIGSLASYDCISYLTVGDKTYMGVTAYYEGSLPIETVLEISPFNGKVESVEIPHAAL